MHPTASSDLDPKPESGIAAAYVPVSFLPARVNVERRADGTLLLTSPEPLQPYARCIGEHLEHWAIARPEQIHLAQRAGDGWRTITYAESLRRVRSLATALLGRGLSAECPVVILSDNSIEHALLSLAAMHIGVPVVPISPAYSLVSRDYQKLRAIFSLLTPGLVFVDDAGRFMPALAAVNDHAFELVAVRNGGTSWDSLLENEDAAAVDQAFAAITPDTIAKFLLTSGSTGEPKAVINTQRMLCSNQQTLLQAWPFLREAPPVLVDWLPWHHTAGGNNCFGLALANGGTLCIDEGKPMPGMIEKTVRNLREIAPTVYSSVPRGYEALLPYLEHDDVLRSNFFSRLKVMQYAGAALPAHVWERLERLSARAIGRRVHMTSGWGSTETAPQVTLVHFEPLRPGVIGLPTPGNELKLVPTTQAGRYELRVHGPNVTPGYWRRDDLTLAAFDEEDFYKIGDAGRFADEADPAQGIEFAGRITEDFKLTSGTWVHTGVLRVKALAALAPVAQDIVIAGHDRDDIRFLIFPNLAGCRSLCPGLEDAALPAAPWVRECVRAGLAQLKADGGGSSTYATAALFLTEPPSIDAGEITDKGYLNQRAVLQRRADWVEKLYADPLPAAVIALGNDE